MKKRNGKMEHLNDKMFHLVLKMLKNCKRINDGTYAYQGIVNSDKGGKWVWYAITRESLQQLHDAMFNDSPVLAKGQSLVDAGIVTRLPDNWEEQVEKL